MGLGVGVAAGSCRLTGADGRGTLAGMARLFLSCALALLAVWALSSPDAPTARPARAPDVLELVERRPELAGILAASEHPSSIALPLRDDARYDGDCARPRRARPSPLAPLRRRHEPRAPAPRRGAGGACAARVEGIGPPRTPKTPRGDRWRGQAGPNLRTESHHDPRRHTKTHEGVFAGPHDGDNSAASSSAVTAAARSHPFVCLGVSSWIVPIAHPRLALRRPLHPSVSLIRADSCVFVDRPPSAQLQSRLRGRGTGAAS